MSFNKYTLFVSAAALLFSAAAGLAQQQAKTAVKPAVKTQVKKQTAAPASKPAAGMVVAKDAETGELRAPTAAEAAALASGTSSIVSSPSSGPVLQRNADGSLTAFLGEESQTYSVMVKGPDGKLTMQCVQGKTAAEKSVAGGMVAKKAVKEVADEK